MQAVAARKKAAHFMARFLAPFCKSEPKPPAFPLLRASRKKPLNRLNQKENSPT